MPNQLFLSGSNHQNNAWSHITSILDLRIVIQMGSQGLSFRGKEPSGTRCISLAKAQSRVFASKETPKEQLESAGRRFLLETSPRNLTCAFWEVSFQDFKRKTQDTQDISAPERSLQLRIAKDLLAGAV